MPPKDKADCHFCQSRKECIALHGIDPVIARRFYGVNWLIPAFLNLIYNMAMRLSVIIPAHNEEKRIAPTLESVRLYLRKQPYDYEIIVVNDGSSDATASLVEN